MLVNWKGQIDTSRILRTDLKKKTLVLAKTACVTRGNIITR